LVLFERAKRRVRLTPTGRRFLDEARDVLARADRLGRDAARMAEGTAGGLEVGYVQGAVYNGVMQRLLRAGRADCPGVHPRLTFMRSAEQAAALSDGRLDIGLAHSPGQGAGLEALKVFSEPFVLLWPRTTLGPA
jgi:DNA-binding transcriptional LysR family regulator